MKQLFHAAAACARVRQALLLTAILLCAGCASPDAAKTLAHDVEFDVIPLDEEAPYVHVIEVSTTNVSLHIGGLPSGGDVPEGADKGVKVATIKGDVIRLELESRESATATGQLTPIWVLTLHDVPQGKYTLQLKISKAACTSLDACTTKKSVEDSTSLDVKPATAP